MENIIGFINNFVEAEYKIRSVSLCGKDERIYSKAVREFAGYFIAGIEGSLLISIFAPRPLSPDDDFFIAEAEIEKLYRRRKVYKVSRYAHKEYGEIFSAVLGPYDRVESDVPSKMLYIIKENDRLMIAANFNIDPLSDKWIRRGGVKGIKTGKLLEEREF
jgi:hypothetical protein